MYIYRNNFHIYEKQAAIFKECHKNSESKQRQHRHNHVCFYQIRRTFININTHIRMYVTINWQLQFTLGRYNGAGSVGATLRPHS